MSGQSHNQLVTSSLSQLLALLLLLCIGFGCLATTCAQRLQRPTRQLLAPRAPFAESFESFDGDGNDDDSSGDDMQRTGDQLRQLLGQQLTNVVAPLTAAPLAALSRRQPGIVAPRSGAEAALRFANTLNDDGDEDDGLSDEDSDEDGDTETETDTNTGTNTGSNSNVAEQPQQQQDYNPYRDNFNEINADGSYVFGYSLPNGVRRWERGYYTEPKHSRVVEGFYAEPRHLHQGIQYELRCYRADANGYHPLGVEYVRQPPRVRRDEVPNLRCLNFRR